MLHSLCSFEIDLKSYNNLVLRWLTRVHGITAIPVSAFYGPDKNDDFIRFCFAKGK